MEVIRTSRITTTIERRRNGLQPACEPCRKAKVRCDVSSTLDICSRCRKRRTPTLCVLLEAPMTKRDSQRRESASQPSINPITQQFHAPHHCSDPNTTENSPGYLGVTSISATLHHPRPENNATNTLDMSTESYPDINDMKIGIEILQGLPDEESCQFMLDCYLEGSAGQGYLPKATMKYAMNSFWSSYRSQLGSRAESSLQVLVKAFTQNTQSPDTQPEEYMEWQNSFSGSNTRWEVIGIMFVAFSFANLSLPQRDFDKLPYRVTGNNRNMTTLKFKACLEKCVHLCRRSLSPLACNLLYKNLMLEALLYGDHSLSAWRLLHDLVALQTAIGLNCYQGTAKISFASEMTKRLSSLCMWADKEISMFTGRPPCLGRQYFSCPMPLDVSDDVLIEGGERLQRELEDLDEDGWNRKGDLHAATPCRIQLLSSKNLDEIMEIFLGNPDQFSIERINAIKTRINKSWSRIPQVRNYTKESLLASDWQDMWTWIFFRIEYLRSHFLLERLAVEKGGESKKNLLDVARELVDLTVFLWLNRDRSVSRFQDFDYAILYFGMPSTGILCSHLIKQIRQPKEVDVKLPVSEVVQNLTFMIGFLEWLKPSAGNYKLCQRMAKTIRHILDEVLEPQPVVNETQLQADEIPEDLWSFNETEDLEWLNNIDWIRGPYTDFK